MTNETLERRAPVPTPADEEGAKRRSLKRRIRWGTVALALAWTLLWVVPGVEAVLTETAIGSGSFGESVETFEVFEMLFVAGHYASRVIPGVALIVVAGLLGGRWLEGAEFTRS